MKIIKNCTCCHKDFEVKTAKARQRIICKECAKKIKREVHKRRMKEFPISFWNWNITTNNEVDGIIKDLQAKRQQPQASIEAREVKYRITLKQ